MAKQAPVQESQQKKQPERGEKPKGGGREVRPQAPGAPKPQPKREERPAAAEGARGKGAGEAAKGKKTAKSGGRVQG